jgi:hypothetical protein
MQSKAMGIAEHARMLGEIDSAEISLDSDNVRMRAE